MRRGLEQWGTGLALALVVALAGGCGPRETPTGYVDDGSATRASTASGVLPQYTVGMKDNAFNPREMVAPAGTTITFLNNCTNTHTVTPDAVVAGAPNSDAMYPNGLQSGQQYTWTVPADAADGTTWYYYCRFHGDPGDGTAMGNGMTGAVRVGTVVGADRTGSSGDYRGGATETGPTSPTAPRNTTTMPGY